MDNLGLAKRLINPPDGNWQPLLDHLADDVVFRVTIPEGTPISGEFRGKAAVTEHFERLPGLLEFEQERPMEFLGDGDRVVVLGRESFRIKKSGVTVSGSEYADVLDFRDGRISRFLVIQDLTAVVDAYRDAHRRGNLELLQRFFTLLNARDIDGWGRLWADDARLLIPYPPPGFPDRITGKTEIVAGMRELFGHFDRYQAAVRETYPSVDPDVIVVEWAVEADLTNGDVYRGENITVFKLRDGLITEYHDYFHPGRFGVVVHAFETAKVAGVEP